MSRERLEWQLENGPLGDEDEMDHWGMEEFFWHGAPGSAFHPIDAYLQARLLTIGS